MLRHLDLNLDPETISPLVLAYIGDAVYELYIRLALVARGSRKMKELHDQAVQHVRAGAQAAFLAKMKPLLTEKELAVVRRGRNAKSGQRPKNIQVQTYRYSTGFEALIGYLYLQGDELRLAEIFQELDGDFQGEGEGP